MLRNLPQLSYLNWIPASLFLLVGFYSTVAQHTVSYNVLEELPRGTLLGSLVTHLPSLLKDKLSQLRFRTIQSEQAQYFHVNISTGELRVKSRLDREAICPSLVQAVPLVDLLRRAPASLDTPCQLSFRVNILRLTRSGVEIENLIRVDVTLEDIDDNRCNFLPSDSQELYIPENTNGTAYLLHSPVDLDTESKHNIARSTIRLQSGSNSTLKYPFHLQITRMRSSITPYRLQLIVIQPLDYEQVRRYQMTIVAGGSAPKSECRLDLTIHTLDRNDHAPVFVQKVDRLSISENTTVNLPFYTAKATDADAGPVFGALRYSLSPFNSPQLHAIFAIHEVNGSVYLKRALNYGQQFSYKLSLQVQNPDLGEDESNGQDQTYVIPTSEIHSMATEARKSVTPADHMDLFIDVIDVNDNRPEIVIYALNGSRQLTLIEHTEAVPADFAVVSVTDEDSGSNGEVSCRLIDPHQEWFELTRIDHKPVTSDASNMVSKNQSLDEGNEIRGALYKLAALRSFDRELETSVSFQVQCEDHGNPPLTSNLTGILWILDINDHDPKFFTNIWYLQVSEDTDPARHTNQFVIGQINATDDDFEENAKLRYAIAEPEVRALISMDPPSGLLRSKGQLDYETNQTLLFTVWVQDSGSPTRSASCRVHLKITDYNDHAPAFEQSTYTFRIQENLPQGIHVGSMHVCDRDTGINAVINFRLSPTIPSQDDDIYAHQQIPFRLTSHYISSSRCYKVQIFTTSVLNRETQLEWIDQSQVYHAQPFKFDLVAEDRGSPAQTARVQIHVVVTDVNDEAPVFKGPTVFQRSILLTAYQPIGAEIFRAHATDRDEGNNGTVQYSLGTITLYEFTANKIGLKPCDELPVQHTEFRKIHTTLNLKSYFQINESSGVFSLRSQLPDQLVGTTCRITIVARDRGLLPLESTINVCLSISDVLPGADGLNRTGIAGGTAMRARGRTSRTVFYLYVVAAISILGLLASVAFVLSAYFLWHRPRSKRTRRAANSIHFQEVDNPSNEGGLEKVEFPPSYETHMTEMGTGGTMIDWPNASDACRAGTTNWTTVPYNTMDQFDNTHVPYHGYISPITEWQSSMPRLKPEQFTAYAYSPQQSIYYHTMRNSHAVDPGAMEPAMVNY